MTLKTAPWLAMIGAICAVTAACSSAAEPASVTSVDRSVRLETTGCGDAAGRLGSGIAVADGVIVTAAHLVVRSDEIAVAIGGGSRQLASLRHIDTQVDVAVLTVAPNRFPTVRTGRAVAGDEGLIVEAATSGTVPYVIDRVVDLSIEDVLGSGRFSRIGYDLNAVTAGGDSGAGVYDDRERLIGMVFAISEQDGSTWATAASEIEPVIEDAADAATTLVCDPARSRVVTP